MAASGAGSPENVELGFAPTSITVVLLGGTTAGYIESDITIGVPREYAFVRGALTPIKHVITAKNLTVSFSAREALLLHLQYAWDTDNLSGLVVTIDDDGGATVALIVKTYAPNAITASTSSNVPISRVISVPKALSTGDGMYTLPKATGGDSNQTIAFDFIALGDTGSTELLGTVTDSYS